ncbi:MAG: DUF2163 domain-containing protein [Polymorphobacter sp.]
MAGAETPLGATLTADLTLLATCWQVIRRDGVALGFTTHDRPLVIGGMRFASAPGMAPSAVVSSDDLAVDTMEVAGALSADVITGADLAAGRYDGAAVQLFLVDWRNPDAGRQRLARGTLGTVEAGTGPDAGFVASLRGPTAAFDVGRIETYSPECRAELGDWRCRVAMRGRVVRTAVVAGDGEFLEVAGIEAGADFVAGSVRVLAGVAAGLERQLLAAEGARLRLDEPLALPIGTAVELRQGCDKRFATCVTRFGNGENFRGEPHVPGNDVLTRFGGL